MSKKIYAVRKGRQTGLFDTWDECKAQVSGFAGAEFKGFTTRPDAEAYLGHTDLDSVCEAQFKADPDAIQETGYAYVDGSYNPDTKISGCGGFLIDDNGVKHIIQKATNNADLTEMHNVGGEILGAAMACTLAMKLGMTSLKIYYDYQGIESWATGAWCANKEMTQRYAKFMQNVMAAGLKIDFVKVKGHSGVDGNEEADLLAKQAVGIDVA